MTDAINNYQNYPLSQADNNEYKKYYQFYKTEGKQKLFSVEREPQKIQQ